jgi:uncharacterized ion transporter superfamily protein YfcC
MLTFVITLTLTLMLTLSLGQAVIVIPFVCPDSQLVQTESYYVIADT